MKKRLISLLLAVSMMLSILPVGAFAAAVQNLTISDATHRPTSNGGGNSGWSYDEDTDTLTIEDGYVMANNVDYPYIACKVVNKGSIYGAIYTNTVTSENGLFMYGIYKNLPTGTFASGSKDFHTISSSDGTAFGLNSKLYNITSAYSVYNQAVTVNAPEGKIVSKIEGARSITSIDTDSARFVMGSEDVTITFANKPGYTEPITKINLALDENGYPEGTNGGTEQVYNGNGWTYQTTTLDNGNNEMTLVIDEGTDTSALKDKVIRVPVRCAGTLNGGTYMEPVEFTTSTEGSTGVFLNEVTLNGQAPADLKELFVMPQIDGFTFNGERSTFTNLERVYILGDPVITVRIPDAMQNSFRYWESAVFDKPDDADYSHDVFITSDHSSEVQVQLGPYTRVRLWAVRKYTLKVNDGSAYTLANDGVTQVPVTEDTLLNGGTMVYLKLDDSFDRTTFDSWTATRTDGFGTDIANASDPDNASFKIWGDTTVSVKTKAPVVKKDFTADMFTVTVDGKALTEEFTAGTPHEICVSANDTASDFHITQFSYYTYNETTGQYENRKAVDIDDNSTWPVNAGKYKIAIAVYDNDGIYNSTAELTDDSWVFEIKASTPSAPHTPVADDFNYKTLNIMIDDVESLAKRLRESITAKDDIINMDDVTILYYTKDGVKLDAVPTEAGEYHFKLEVKAAADGSYTATDPEQPLTDINWKFWIRTPSYSVSVTGGQFYILKGDGTRQYPSSELGIPVGTKVHLELDKTYADDLDFEFKGWQLAEGSTKLDGDYNLTLKDGSYFTMPNGNVKLTLITDSGNQGDDTTISSGGDSGAGVAVVLGGAALTGAAYLVGTQVYLETTLGSVPTNRQQMALALWNKAGKPEPVSTELFTDISAAAADSQKAARWCVEQGLMKAEGTTFNPDKYVFRPQVIKAWNDMQAKLKAD